MCYKYLYSRIGYQNSETKFVFSDLTNEIKILVTYMRIQPFTVMYLKNDTLLHLRMNDFHFSIHNFFLVCAVP